MEINTRRSFFGKIAAMAAVVTGAPRLFSQQTSPAGPPPPAGAPMAAAGDDRAHRAPSHIHDGIYYFSGTGSNDGYPKEDHILVTDPFEKHVTRTMDALKKSGLHHGQHHPRAGVFLPAPCRRSSHAERKGTLRCL
jgi:hypothetical protein